MAVKVCFHTLCMGDVEDPYLYAAVPISQWQKTEHGIWVMEHAADPPVFYCEPDFATLGYRVSIVGSLHDKDYTYHQLKWGVSK